MLHLGIVPIAISVYRYFFPKWVKTTAKVSDTICIMGSTNISTPYICSLTVEYTVNETVLKQHIHTNYHRELVEDEVIDLWYDHDNPTRTRVL